MKTASHQVAAVLGNPARFTGILFYGDDFGRMRDGVRTATRSVIGEVSDPFRFSALTREEHGRLREEVGSRALGGGRRVVRVQDAATRVELLEHPCRRANLADACNGCVLLHADGVGRDAETDGKLILLCQRLVGVGQALLQRLAQKLTWPIRQEGHVDETKLMLGYA